MTDSYLNDGPTAMPFSEVTALLKEGNSHHLHDGRYWCLQESRRHIAQSEQTLEGNGVKNLFKRWPALYSVLVSVVGPSLFTGLTANRFVQSLPAEMQILHAGSGTRSFGECCVNVDLFPFPNVQVIADLSDLPFRDGVFDAVTCEQVLEHVPCPWEVAAELRRVTKSGGLIHIASPFVFPWHASPSDYSRWTLQGLAAFFPDCEVVQQGVTAGIFSALVAFIAAFFSIMFSFGSRKIQSMLEMIFLLLLSPLKLLDFLFAHFPFADRLAANVFIVVRVPLRL